MTRQHTADPTERPTDREAIRHSRFESLNRMGQPFVLVGLIVAVNMGVAFSGMALLQGKLEGPNYLAIMTGLFGLIGGGALGMATGRGGQRASDPAPGLPTTSATSTTTTTETIPPPAEPDERRRPPRDKK